MKGSNICRHLTKCQTNFFKRPGIKIHHLVVVFVVDIIRIKFIIVEGLWLDKISSQNI